MNSKSSDIASKQHPRRIRSRDLVSGILIKEKTRLLLIFAYLTANSVTIYWLSAFLVERTPYQVYVNPTIVLYFRLLIMSSPLIIGLVVGVPLLSTEYESGTYRYLFTHGVGRRRLLRTIFAVYFVSILLFSMTTVVSVSHFLNLQQATESIPMQSAQLFTNWSFGIFFSRPIIIIPLTLTAFVTGVFLGALSKRVIPGIVVTMLYGVLFALGLKAFFDKLLNTLIQGLYDSTGNTFHQHYDFYGRNDPKYLFQFQILFASLLMTLTIALVFGSLRALNSEGFFHRKLEPS